eukprot:364268-Chlamydomonas_euryale.AAC.22
MVVGESPWESTEVVDGATQAPSGAQEDSTRAVPELPRRALAVFDHGTPGCAAVPARPVHAQRLRRLRTGGRRCQAPRRKRARSLTRSGAPPRCCSRQTAPAAAEAAPSPPGVADAAANAAAAGMAAAAAVACDAASALQARRVREQVLQRQRPPVTAVDLSNGGGGGRKRGEGRMQVQVHACGIAGAGEAGGTGQRRRARCGAACVHSMGALRPQLVTLPGRLPQQGTRLTRRDIVAARACVRLVPTRARPKTILKFRKNCLLPRTVGSRPPALSTPPFSEPRPQHKWRLFSWTHKLSVASASSPGQLASTL